MLIEVFDGVIDAMEISALTPVIKNNIQQQGVQVIDKPLYIFQITMRAGARINCTYESKLEAETERAFVLDSWMAVRNQDKLPNTKAWEAYKAKEDQGEYSDEKKDTTESEQPKKD